VQPNKGTEHGAGARGGTRRSGEREEKKKRKEKGRGGKEKEEEEN
jgi:hypothetical protein